MVQLGVGQLVEILQGGRETAIDRVWMAAETAMRRFAGRVELYLIVRVGPCRTVSVKTVHWSGQAVERLLPGATVRVDGLGDLEDLGDPAALEVLLHMAEMTDRLSGRDDGLWQVITASGTVYLLELSPDQRALVDCGSAQGRWAGHQGVPRLLSARCGRRRVQTPDRRTTGTLLGGAGSGRQVVAAPDAVACAAHVE